MPGLIDPALGAAAMALGDAGYQPSQIAPAVGLPRTTVNDIIARHGRWGAIAEKPVFVKWRLEQQQLLEAGYRESAGVLLAHAMREEKLDKSSTYQLVIASKIALDASRLLAGESTANVDLHVAVQGMDALASALGQALLANPVDNSQVK